LIDLIDRLIDRAVKTAIFHNILALCSPCSAKIVRLTTVT